MKKHLFGAVAVLTIAMALAPAAQAHRQWMVPSATVLSGGDVWVTVDAAVSNDLFYFEHQPLRLDAMKAFAPDGSEVAIEHANTGRYRSTFDVHLTQPGTWRIVSASDGVMGSYMLDGKRTRLPRGTTAANLEKAVPAGATDVQTAIANNRNEIFVTVGAPTTTLFTPTGKGIEMVPVTHPNDLFVGEEATFQFLLDGQPAADLPVTVVRGGIRYRSELGQMDMTTGADGKLSLTWPEPGLYWLNVTLARDDEDGPPNPDAAPQRRASYVTTLEVLAP